ncbi:MAG: trypsin-like peptidase domain-containing protein [Candidatus Latescibacteria bacterium]|nr:trypsin-like peptidase domain-containing protein [Candidatus Latescibacterota bacterium]
MNPRTLRLLTLLNLAVFAFLLFPVTEASGQTSTPTLTAIEQEVVGLVERVQTSIVSIVAQRRFMIPVDGHILTTWDRDVGSGIVISPSGHILTTASVVKGANALSLSLADGRQQPARLVGVDPLSSIAVVQADSAGLLPAGLGDSDSIRAGTWAIMIGNAFGLPSSPSFGLVNGVRSEDGLLQINAMASPGSTGGAVVASDGRVIGLIVGKLTVLPDFPAIFHSPNQAGTFWTAEGPFSGALLAIPMNRALTIARQLIEFGEVRRSWLGVEIESLAGREGGVPIDHVYEGSPAQAAGLRKGDILLSVNGLPTTSPFALADRVANIPVGTEVELQYIRNSHQEVKRVRLGQRPALLDRRQGDEAREEVRPVEAGPNGPKPVLTEKSLTQWLLELQAEIQRLKNLEGERQNEQMRRVKAQPRR